MQVQVLTARIASARENLQKVELSPTRAAAMQQLAQDEAILGNARGSSVEEMEQLARQAERLEKGTWGAAIATGLAIGGVVAWQVALQGAHPFLVLGGLSSGMLPAIVLGRFASDAMQKYTARHIQTPGVLDVVTRWKEPQTAPRAPEVEPGRQNELTRLIDQVAGQVNALPDGPEKASALESIGFDRSLAGQAKGETLEEMRSGCARAARCEEKGRRLGLGLGVAFGGLALGVMLADPTIGLPMALLGSAGGGFMASICLGVALKDAGRDLGSRFQKRGVDSLLERWSPLAQDRRDQAAAILEEATRLHQGGTSSAVTVENGGVRVGGVFIRGRATSKDKA